MKLSILNLITVNLSITTFLTVNLTGFNRSRTLLHALLLRLLNPDISLPFSNHCIGLSSTNAFNIKLVSFTNKVLTTSQPSYLHSLISLNLLAVLAAHLLSPFLAHQLFPDWKSPIALLDMHHLAFGINFQIHFVSLVGPVSIHLIHMSTHLCHHRHSHHPSLLCSFTPGAQFSKNLRKNLGRSYEVFKTYENLRQNLRQC